MARIARVEPLTTARAVRGPFDYLVDGTRVDVGSLVVVPFARRRILGVVVGLAEDSEVAPERLATLADVLELDVPAELVELAHWVAQEYCSTPARALALVLPPGSGDGKRPPAGARTALGAQITPAGRDALAGGPRLGERQRAALEALHAAAASLPVAGLPADHATLRRLEERGLVAIEPLVRERRPVSAPIGAAHTQAPAPTPEQEAALGAIAEALALGPGSDPVRRRFLLHGVTGSGKTEVYLRAAAATLEQGRGAIVLVPEIGLTPQALGRFRARFGDTVAVIHSQLSVGERRDEWSRLRRGDARICVGPRSAVFAPVGDLGLIVVDEEHDSSYKHEGDPRYDARSVALERATREGAVLVAGTATPRPESFEWLPRLQMRQRVDARGLPPVEVVDMRGAAHPLHPRTREALAEVRRDGGKAIVMLNRRGWSNFLSCRSCGYVWGCPNCDVTLVLHRAAGVVGCHHCGHRERIPGSCPVCSSLTVARHGAGTEQLEELLAGYAAPGFEVVRLDSDVAAVKGRAERLLSRFDRAQAGILIGTQMVAKGHDFPDVRLGVVLDADSTLRFPDLRSEERTFALVTQLAGRAGRGEGDSRVIVQTLTPDAPAIELAARHDADGFLRGELARREALRYPPFGTLVRIVCSGEADSAADAAARALREVLAVPDATVLGPAALFRLRGRERSQLEVKAPAAGRGRAAAIAAIGAAVDGLAKSRAHQGVSISVDVDPQ
jgi:primosomal protein N' (replication factor Y)